MSDGYPMNCHYVPAVFTMQIIERLIESLQDKYCLLTEPQVRFAARDLKLVSRIYRLDFDSSGRELGSHFVHEGTSMTRIRKVVEESAGLRVASNIFIAGNWRELELSIYPTESERGIRCLSLSFDSLLQRDLFGEDMQFLDDELASDLTDFLVDSAHLIDSDGFVLDYSLEDDKEFSSVSSDEVRARLLRESRPDEKKWHGHSRVGLVVGAKVSLVRANQIRKSWGSTNRVFESELGYCGLSLFG